MLKILSATTQCSFNQETRSLGSVHPCLRLCLLPACYVLWYMLILVHPSINIQPFHCMVSWYAHHFLQLKQGHIRQMKLPTVKQWQGGGFLRYYLAEVCSNSKEIKNIRKYLKTYLKISRFKTSEHKNTHTHTQSPDEAAGALPAFDFPTLPVKLSFLQNASWWGWKLSADEWHYVRPLESKIKCEVFILHIKKKLKSPQTLLIIAMDDLKKAEVTMSNFNTTAANKTRNYTSLLKKKKNENKCNNMV